MARKEPKSALDIFKANMRTIETGVDLSNHESPLDFSIMDSLDWLEFVMAMEEDLGVQIPKTEWEKWSGMTLTQIAESLDALQGGNKS